MDDAVRKREIHPRIVVHRTVEVVGIAREVPSEAMIPVEHGRHAVEAETVEMELVEPVAAVRKQKMEHVRLAVVEAARIPGLVPALRSGVEILAVGAVEARKAVALVLDGMGMHEIHDHPQAHAMRRIHERLEVLGRAETRRRREEAGHVVAKAAVVRMLHDRHQLHGVVAGRLDARQRQVPKLGVGPHLALFLGHAHMRLVDERRAACGAGRRMPPDVRLRRLPHLGGKELAAWILHHAAGIGGNAFAFAAGPADIEPIKLPVPNRRRREAPFPHVAPGNPLQLKRLLAPPAGEVAHQPHPRGVRRPFAEDPASADAMEPVVFVGAGPVGKRFALADKFVRPCARTCRPTANGVREREKIRIVQKLHCGH